MIAACGQDVERDRPDPTPDLSPPSTPTPTAAISPTPTGGPLPTDTIVLTPTPTAISPAPTSVATATPSPPTINPTPDPGLFLQILGPEDGITVRGNAVVVFGNASPGSRVTVAGQVVALERDGRFQAEVEVSPGPNTIEVVAETASGERLTETLTVNGLETPSQPFNLVITSPTDQSIVSSGTVPVSGRTTPDAVVTVNGVSIAVDEIGIFSTTVTLEEGPNLIEVVATGGEGDS